MDRDNQLKTIIANIKSIVTYLDELQKDLNKFQFEEAMQKIEMLKPLFCIWMHTYWEIQTKEIDFSNDHCSFFYLW